ncbi:hypothetical protein TNCV_3281391 [Trichonephila clavipes]|nr:hypothetical protein TNCV_3281391 [Trichonephila clavipes]
MVMRDRTWLASWMFILKKIYFEEKIQRVQWPARPSDLNPIEHIWDVLGQRQRIIGKRGINGTLHNVFGKRAIKEVYIVILNNKVHYEVLRKITNDRLQSGGKHICLMLSCFSYVVDYSCL